MRTDYIQSLCMMDRDYLNDLKRGNISGCFPCTPLHSSAYTATSLLRVFQRKHVYYKREQIECLHTAWDRNGIPPCTLLHADSSGVTGIAPSHHSTAENRASSVSGYCNVSKSADSLLLCRTRRGCSRDTKCCILRQRSLCHTSSDTALHSNRHISFTCADIFGGHVWYLSNHVFHFCVFFVMSAPSNQKQLFP